MGYALKIKNENGDWVKIPVVANSEVDKNEAGRVVAEEARVAAEEQREKTHAQMRDTVGLANEVMETHKQNLANGLYDGVDGVDGVDGLTPYIGENGTWWIGPVDTGIGASLAPLIASGTFKGIGENSIELTFDFEPKTMVILQECFDEEAQAYVTYKYMWLNGMDRLFETKTRSDIAASAPTVVVSGNTLRITNITSDSSFSAIGYTAYYSVTGSAPYVLTEEDKAELIEAVINALPTWEGGSY